MMLRLILTLGLGLSAVACVSDGRGARQDDPSVPIATPAGEAYDVNWVIDGDTIRVVSEAGTETVRLIGIDSPEVDGPHTKPECHGEAATAYARQLLEGRRVRLESDPSQDRRDRFGRLLAYVWLDEGGLVNLKMVEDGHAYEYTYDRTNPYRFQENFRDAEDTAKNQNRGLWASDTCNGDRWAPTASSSE